MITKQKYNLLKNWTQWYGNSATPETVGLTCFSCGIAGVVVAELPDNHKIFDMPLIEAAPALSEIVDSYGGKIKIMLDANNQ